MRNIISILIFFFLGAGASGLVGVGFGSNQLKGKGIAASAVRDDLPVDTVRYFWWLSLRESPAAQNLISAPPASFFDKRCPNGVPGVTVTAEVQDNWIRKSVIKLSARIAGNQIPGESVQLISEVNDEAVVLVSYLDPSQPESGTILQYVFLHRKQGKWKLFLTLRHPVFHNTSYAGLSCTV